MIKAKTTMPATQSGNAIVVYEPDETMRLDVRLEHETVWLTQEQMCQLFGRTQSVIARHIGNIFKEGELDRKVVYAKFAYTTRHGLSKLLRAIDRFEVGGAGTHVWVKDKKVES